MKWYYGDMSNRVFKVGNDVELVDSSGTETGTTSNRLKVESKDIDVMSLLNRIYKELQKTNFYLADMANVGYIENEDII